MTAPYNIFTVIIFQSVYLFYINYNLSFSFVPQFVTDLIHFKPSPRLVSRSSVTLVFRLRLVVLCPIHSYCIECETSQSQGGPGQARIFWMTDPGQRAELDPEQHQQQMERL